MPWKTIREAAEILGKNPRTIYRYTDKRALPVRIKNGKRQVLVKYGQGNFSNVTSPRFNRYDLEPLFDVFENLLKLNRLFIRIIAKEKAPNYFDQCTDNPSPGLLDEWTRLHERFKPCLSEVDLLVQMLTLKPDKLQKWYREMARMRLTWETYTQIIRRRDPGSCSSQTDIYNRGLILMDEIIEDLRSCLKECQ